LLGNYTTVCFLLISDFVKPSGFNLIAAIEKYNLSKKSIFNLFDYSLDK